MSASQARPVTALLARKGRAAPVGAAFDTAQVSNPATGPDFEALPEVGAAARSAAAPPASLLPLDYFAGQSGPRGVALQPPDPPPDPPEAAFVPAAKPAPTEIEAPAVSVKSQGPRPDPALRLAPGRERRRVPALAAGLALALLLGAGIYGHQSGWFLSRQPEESQAPRSAPPEATAESLPAAPPATEDNPPSVDVVRIEPDGAAVIAGRAAPGAELILLDNGTPIGTVTADASGAWVFIPASPLPSGAHDFGLVIKEVRGGVSVPAAGKASSVPGVPALNKPGTVAGAAAAVPIPPRKPDTGLEPAADGPAPAFVVQLASLKTRAGAEREWRTLRRRFPEILSQMSLSLDEAKLAGGAAVVRLRTGAFPKQGEAAAFCARLAVKHQDCLVVRTAFRR